RQGYGGSCYTPLVRDAAPSDIDRVGLRVTVTNKKFSSGLRSYMARIVAIRNASEYHPVVLSVNVEAVSLAPCPRLSTSLSLVGICCIQPPPPRCLPSGLGLRRLATTLYKPP
ncbi:unnamed protein product, partial [Ectocarpus sp. 13 AM-2016]